MSRANLPQALHAAYNWTEAAGELDELRSLAEWPGALAMYAAASQDNAAEADQDLGTEPDVFAADIIELAAWLAWHFKPKDEPNYDFLTQWGGYDFE